MRCSLCNLAARNAQRQCCGIAGDRADECASIQLLADQLWAQVGLAWHHCAVVDDQVGIACAAARLHQVDAERAVHRVGVGDGGLVDQSLDGRGRVLGCLAGFHLFGCHQGFDDNGH